VARATAPAPRFRRPAERAARARPLCARLALTAAALALAGLCAAATGTPEQDRQRLVEFFTARFPGVALEDYVYGAMIASADARSQYEQIMEFPPFLSDIEAGKKIWETPFRNGKRFADCFPNGGRNAVGNYPRYDEAQGRVVTFEGALNLCRQANGEPPLAYG
jgi:sulfur-oxidizing protein SoxA